MSGPLGLAWRYVRHHKVKSLILIASVVLTVLLPITIRILLWQFNQKVASRADATQAVVGATGSDLDLALNATYFRINPDMKTIRYDEVKYIEETGLATAIPVHARFTAKNFHVVGTSLDYFEYRGLEVEDGFAFGTLGDCVLGYEVAQQLGLKPGQRLESDRRNALAFAGETPLRMTVAGVLKPSGSPDDRVVFVDVKTTWVIEGLGHGHEDLSNAGEDSVQVLKKTDKQVIASAGVTEFIEITDSNIGSFHFHGNVDDFPLTSIIVVAKSEESETILQGRYQTEPDRSGRQLARPPVVIRELMGMVLRVNRFFEANSMLVGLATAMLLVLVVVLSLRLRAREMKTMFRIGCSRGTIVWLQVWELVIVFAAAAVVLTGLVVWVWSISGEIVQSLLIG